MNPDQSDERISELCESGEIYSAMEEYLFLCSCECDASPDNAPLEKESSSKRKKDRTQKTSFPNLAGFCRYLGVGTQELESVRTEYPLVYGRLLTVLEDEALNSSLSPSLLSTYLKRRIGYESAPAVPAAEGQLEIKFEHDIFEDGE